MDLMPVLTLLTSPVVLLSAGAALLVVARADLPRAFMWLAGLLVLAFAGLAAGPGGLLAAPHGALMPLTVWAATLGWVLLSEARDAHDRAAQLALLLASALLALVVPGLALPPAASPILWSLLWSLPLARLAAARREDTAPARGPDAAALLRGLAALGAVAQLVRAALLALDAAGVLALSGGLLAALGRVATLDLAAALSLAFAATLRQREIATLVAGVRTDAATGVDNATALAERLDDELSRAARGYGPLGVVLCEPDRYPALVEHLGQPAAEDALREFAGALQEALRKSDRVARVEGARFAVLLPHTAEPDVRATVIRLRNTLREQTWTTSKGDVALSVSWGFTMAQANRSAEEVTEAARLALAHARQRADAIATCPDPDSAPLLVPPVASVDRLERSAAA